MADSQQMPPGYAVIESALDRVYGEDACTVLHRPLTKGLGGPDVIDDFYVYKVDDPVPHWHFVTAGLTELDEKASNDPHLSGFGFEFSLRVRRDAEEEHPPNWAANFLENIAKYVFDTGNPFGDGHTMNLNSPIALGTDTEIRAMAMRVDPVLGKVDSPNGSFTFLQVVGLTLDELQAMKAWTTHGMLSELSAVDPLLIVNLDRKSILTDASAARRVAERTEAEGASTDVVFITAEGFKARGGLLRKKRITITLGAFNIEEVAAILRGRIRFGRDLTFLFEDDRRIVMTPASTCSWRRSGKTLVLNLTDDAAARLAERWVPRAGEFVLPEIPDVTWRIVKTTIRNQDGEPAETIG